MLSNQLKNYYLILVALLQRKAVRQILYVVIILASLTFIGVAVAKTWNEIKTQSWDIDYRFILLSVVLYPVGMLPTATAWHTLLQALGIRKTFRTDLHIYSLSSLPRHVPGFVWFLTSRTLLYQEQGVSAALTIAATGAETVLLALTGFIASASLLPLNIKAVSRLPALPIIAILAAVVLLITVAGTPFLNRLLLKFLSRKNLEQPSQFSQKKLIISLLWMFIAWGGGGLILFTLAQAITPINWSLIPLMIGIWGAAGAVSLTIGIGIQGMGIREVTLGALLSLIMPPITAIVVAIAFRLVLTVGEFLWVAFFAWITKVKGDGHS